MSHVTSTNIPVPRIEQESKINPCKIVYLVGRDMIGLVFRAIPFIINSLVMFSPLLFTISYGISEAGVNETSNEQYLNTILALVAFQALVLIVYVYYAGRVTSPGGTPKLLYLSIPSGYEIECSQLLHIGLFQFAYKLITDYIFSLYTRAQKES